MPKLPKKTRKSHNAPRPFNIEVRESPEQKPDFHFLCSRWDTADFVPSLVPGVELHNKERERARYSELVELKFKRVNKRNRVPTETTWPLWISAWTPRNRWARARGGDMSVTDMLNPLPLQTVACRWRRQVRRVRYEFVVMSRQSTWLERAVRGLLGPWAAVPLAVLQYGGRGTKV